MNDNKPGHRPLRRPAAWLDQPLPRAKGAMDNWLLLSGGAIGLVVGITGLLLDSKTLLVLGLGWVLCFLVMWVVFLTSDRRLRHSAPPVSSAYVERLRQQAVVIAYRQRGIDVLLLAALIVLPLSVLLAIDASRRDGAALSSVAGFGLVSAAAVWLIVRACSTSYRDSRRQRFVAVGKAGLLHDTVEWKAFYLWDDIFQIGASPLPRQRVEVFADTDKTRVDDRRLIRLPRLKGVVRGINGFDAGALVMDRPAVVYWGLRFYQQNPEHRAELGTEVGLRRFQNGDFPYDEEP